MAEVSIAGQAFTSRSTTADGSWIAWSSAGISGIWVAVVLTSILAPDMVTGSEHEHMPLATATCWLWGLIATIGFLWAMRWLRGSASRRPIWIGLAAVTLVLWLVATVLTSHCRWSRRGRILRACQSAPWSRPWRQRCSRSWRASLPACSPLHRSAREHRPAGPRRASVVPPPPGTGSRS
jgi:hypothetical protein